MHERTSSLVSGWGLGGGWGCWVGVTRRWVWTIFAFLIYVYKEIYKMLLNNDWYDLIESNL